MKRKSLSRTLPVLAFSGISLALALASDASANKPTNTAKPRKTLPASVKAAIKKNQQRLSQTDKKRLATFVEQAAKPDSKSTRQNKQVFANPSKDQIAEKYHLPRNSIGNRVYKIDGYNPIRSMGGNSAFYWVFYNPKFVDRSGWLRYGIEDSHARIRLANIDPKKGYLVECEVEDTGGVYLSWPSRDVESYKQSGGTISLFVSNSSDAILYLRPAEQNGNSVKLSSCKARAITL